MANLIEVIIRQTGAQQAGAGIQGFSKNLLGLDSALAQVGLGVGLGALFIKTVQWTGAAIQAGAEAERAERSFTNLSGSVEKAQLNLEAMNRATRGQASEMAQMSIASQLLGMNIATTDAELEKVVAVSSRLGRAFRGIGAAEAANEFAMMMSNMSVMRLDTFGISSGAVRARIEELMTTTAGMTREQAFFQATMEQADATLARLGPSTKDLSASQAEMAASMDDFKAAFGGAILAIAGGTGVIDFLTAQFRAARVDAENYIYVFKDAIPTIQAYNEEQLRLATVSMSSTVMAVRNAESYDQVQAAYQDASRDTKAFQQALAASFPTYEDYISWFDKLADAGMADTRVLIGSRKEFDALASAGRRAAVGIGVMSMGAQIAASRMTSLAAAIKLASDASARLATGKVYTGTEIAMAEERDLDRRQQYLQNRDRIDADAAQRTTDAIAASNAEQIKRQEEGSGAYESAIDDMASTLRSTIESVLQPTLSEVWKPPEGAEGRIDEWARRLATMSTGNLDSEWRAQLTAQFGGQGFFQPIMDALSAGDSGALAAAVNNVLMGPGVMQLWDKDLIKAKVLEDMRAKNAREELVNTVMAELSGQGVQVTAGEVGVAMGGAAPGGDIAGQLVGGMKAGLPGALADSGMALTMIASINTAIAGNKKEMEGLAFTFMKNFNSYLPTALKMAPGGFLEALVIYVSAQLGGGAGTTRAAKAEARP